MRQIVNNNYNNGGAGFLSLLTLLFIALKLCGVITWSWWWVLSPLWIPASIFLGIAILALLVWASVTVVDYFIKKK